MITTDLGIKLETVELNRLRFALQECEDLDRFVYLCCAIEEKIRYIKFLHKRL